MKSYKEDILKNICYTELVYGRINKKLKSKFSKLEIEKKLLDIITVTEEQNFQKIGKNVYITNSAEEIRITINLNTFRVITVDSVK